MELEPGGKLNIRGSACLKWSAVRFFFFFGGGAALELWQMLAVLKAKTNLLYPLKIQS